MSSLRSRRPSRTLLPMSAGSSAARKARTSARKASSSWVKLRSMPSSPSSFDQYDDLAARRARGKARDGRSALLEWQPLGDHRPHASLGVERHQRGDVCRVPFGEAPRKLAPEHPDDIAALEEREV